MESVLGPWSLIDLAVIAGVALVVPAGLGHARLWWPTAAAVAVAAALPQGSVAAVTLASAWPLVAAVVTALIVTDAGPPRSWGRAEVVAALASGYGLVAATWFVLSCAAATPMGIDEPIVELTAVHFTYVGVGALVLADASLDRGRRRTGRSVGWAALGFTASAPPVVAGGFVTGWAVVQIGGAVLMSLGVCCTAALELAAALRPGRVGSRVALAVSGLSIWAPMALAVAWATAQHHDVPALSTADMVPTHGAANAVGFIAAGLIARRLDLHRCHHERGVRDEIELDGRRAPIAP